MREEDESVIKRGVVIKMYTLKSSIWHSIFVAYTRATALLCLALLFFLPNPVSAQGDTDFYGRYPFIRFVDSGEADSVRYQLSDDDLLDHAGSIVFRVNKYDVFVNDSLLRLLEEEIIPRINRDSLVLESMVLRGAASPEGPWLNNKMLGERRAQTLIDFLCSRLAFSDGQCPHEVKTLAEDYPLLCAMMRRAGDADLPVVEALCERYLPHKNYAALKRELRQVRQGQLWDRLLRDYFPELRTARVVLFFRKYHSSPPKMVLGEIPLPKADFPVYNLRPLEVGISHPVDIMSSYRVRSHRRELLSVKTNLLFYGAYVPGYNRWCPIPNVAVEFYPLHGHFTVGASFDCPWWQNFQAHKYFQIRNYQVEGRYYLRSGDIRKNPPGQGAAFRGFYASAYAHIGLFGICFNENKGWVGEGLGAGVGVGYVLPLSRKGHWRLEFALQAGYFRCKYDPYQYENPVNPAYRDNRYYYKWTGDPKLFKTRQYRFGWFGPTRVGVTLSYDLLYRRQSKRGVSFRSWEWKR